MFALCSCLLFIRWSLSVIKGASGSLNLLELSKEHLRALILSRHQEEVLQAGGGVHLNRVQSGVPLAFACKSGFFFFFLRVFWGFFTKNISLVRWSQ